ncbi:MAG: 4Fe-4S binding protein [Planctomycetota bacterium]|nr:4Fe-4S binding protein [Planctomycetota bacterium]
MPWVNHEMCTGCGICVRECPVEAMSIGDSGYADIDEDACIRCGKCHDVCPQEAVRHDSERIPHEVADNLRWVRKLLGNFQESTEQAAFMQRMVRFFNKQKKVNEQTIDAIKAAEDDPAESISAAIRGLSVERDTGPSKGE